MMCCSANRRYKICYCLLCPLSATYTPNFFPLIFFTYINLLVVPINTTKKYLYLNATCPEARKSRKKCADLCEVKPKEGAIKQLVDLGLATAVKTNDLHSQYILP